MAIDTRDSFKLILAAAIVVILVLFATLQRYESGPHVPPPGGDSLLFYQYARAMAEGHPYRFYPDDAPTTGSTSHSFPALLALLYALGARDEALSTASFALDAVFYLLVILGVWAISLRLYPRAAPLAAALTLASGHILHNVFYQHDMGLFAPLAIGALWAALAGRPILLGVLLMLATLTRPEGMVMSLLLVLVSFLPVGATRRPDWKFVAAGAIGLLGFGAVLLLNRYLTGHAAFTSILGKGLLGKDSTIVVLSNIAQAYRDSFLGLLFGIGEPALRYQQFILLPVFGGALALVGLASRPWSTGVHSRLELWWVLLLIAMTAMISTAGPIGNLFERYYTWVLPLWFMYASIGACEIARASAFHRATALIALVLIAYQAVGLVYFGSLLNISTAQLASQRDFVRRVNDQLPPGTDIGTEGTCYAAYDLPRHKVHNVWGIVSPEFVYTGKEPWVNIETLREDPAIRFDYWLINAANANGVWYSPFVGEALLSEPPLFSTASTMVLHRADWSSLLSSGMPLGKSALARLDGLHLVDKMNVGYVPDEERCEFVAASRLPGAYLPMMSETLSLGGRSVTEAGRVVLGNASMTVNARPGHEMLLVMRTSLLGGVQKHSGVQRFAVDPQLRLKVFVDEEEAGEFSFLLGDVGEFTEAAFRIPAALISRERVRIRLEGDHIAYAYWFYQEAADRQGDEG